MKRKNKLKTLAVLMALGWMSSPARATNTPIDATITVTPVANVSLAIAPTTYAFGNIAVNTSTNSATALSLSNNGQVDVTVDKRITSESTPAGWTAGSSAALNTYVLYAATSTARALTTDFTVGNAALGALNNVTALTGTGGSTPIVTVPGGALNSVNLWFKLDMPTVVSSQVGHSITVRFTGTAQ